MNTGKKPAAKELNKIKQLPTIHDVARLAGVSISTVSKAMNAGGRMRPETREKVNAIAAEIGYRPNHFAQGLHRDKSMTVGIISRDNFGRFSFPIAAALEKQFTDRGIAVFMCNATDDPAREQHHLNQLMQKRIDGLIVTSRRANKRPPLNTSGHKLPVVYVFAEADDPDAYSLLPDDKQGARLAVDHLIGLGRKNIAHITGPETYEAARLRYEGYKESLSDAGLEPNPAHYLSGNWSEIWGREAVEQLFDQPAPAGPQSDRPDALFCGNDQIARGAAEALRERGINIPQQVAIVGFDNWDVMTGAARPPLSSIDMNLEELGERATTSLIDMIAGLPLTGVQSLPCTLVVRGSSD